MRKQKLAFGLLCATVLIVAPIYFASTHHPRVFGDLSAADLREIDRVVHRDLRRFELPTPSRQNLSNPRYVFASVQQYASRRLLWVSVQDDRTVRAYVGNDKQKIAADGWSYVLHKDANWRIGSMAYWGSPERAPQDLKIPAGL